jgi:hypothetical protein
MREPYGKIVLQYLFNQERLEDALKRAQRVKARRGGNGKGAASSENLEDESIHQNI